MADAKDLKSFEVKPHSGSSPEPRTTCYTCGKECRDYRKDKDFSWLQFCSTSCMNKAFKIE